MISLADAEEVLKHEYQRENFEYLVKEILLPDYKPDFHETENNSDLFQNVNYLGESLQCDISVFEVEIAEGVENRRVAITQAMFKLLKGLRIDNALIAFYNHDKLNFRISLLTSKYEYDGDKIVKMLSNPRRYSYSLGYGTKTKTAYDFLIKKGKVANLDELISRFSVEVVNKDFYRQIATCFTMLVGGNRDGMQYDKMMNLHGIVDQNKFAEFAVRLIGRIMFCWFLKEKKSGKGIPLIPEAMLSVRHYPDDTKSYYHEVLEPLFFELLNINQNRRKDKYLTEEIYKQIPYLNGGLFNPQSDDFYKYDRINCCGQYGMVNIHNEWFKKFFEVLSQYNFTVDENTSYDIELSIDPEMLGRIFENLLAEINPETGTNAKKSTGSFYTPRDIVDYMVDNSILEYLKEKTGINEIKLKALISYNNDDDDLAVFDADEKKSIIKALYSVTVLDPACGSGAFPIGMLQKIVYVLQEVDPEANLWFSEVTKDVPIFIKKEFEKKFNAGSLNYIRKLSVIQNSIFGIDIQPIAVEISRLRCFLSLIIEEKVDDSEPNRGINPLPNLDFKIIIANSLIGLENNKIEFQKQRIEIGSLLENEDYIAELKAVREEYFNAEIDRRSELKLEFSEIQKKMFKDTIDNYGAKNASTKYQQLSDWSPFINKPTSWFDPEWMFGVKDGFDIVIANPPYVESRNANFDIELKEILQRQIKCMYSRKFASLIPRGSDLLIYFLEASIRFINTDGIVTFITSNGWLNNEYGHKFQKFLIESTNIMAVIDTDFKYFENANINTVITCFKGNKATNQDIHFITHHKKFADVVLGVEFDEVDNDEIKVIKKTIKDVNMMKWGTYFTSDNQFFEMMKILKQYGKKLGERGLTIGQGLNLSERDKYILKTQDLSKFNLQNEKIIPFMNKEETGNLNWINSNNFIVDKNKLNNYQIQELETAGIKLFDSNSTNKDKPILIMPRGIGEKHYCTFNTIAGYSDSGVEIYGRGVSFDDILRIWLFCNSTICWLIREKFGRKNLGGGMLKAEAIDLKNIPLFFNFDNMDKIKTIFSSASSRKANNCLIEIEDDLHVSIDGLVFDYLQLSSEFREYIIETFKETVATRTKKSKSKV